VTRIAIIGGGLAGLASAAALGSAGFPIDLFEARPFLGGRATSYPLPGAEEGAGEAIDNCQHILLRCCVNLLDFYKRLNVDDAIAFHRDIYFMEPGGRTSILKAGALPAPLHFTESFLRLRFLHWSDKIAVGRALLAIRTQRTTRKDLDRLTMLDWLREQKQTERAIERFWRQVLVSAINEELDRMAASHGFQVFWLGFLSGSRHYEMGIPSKPLGELYTSDSWKRLPNVTLHPRCPVEAIQWQGDRAIGVTAAGRTYPADAVISAVSFERARVLLPDLPVDWAAFEHSPITGIHLWFDRPVTDLPHATLLDTTIQWFFNKGRGRYLMLVVSASRNLAQISRNDLIALAVQELGQFLPAVRAANIEKAHVVKEMRATFSAATGLEEKRPLAVTRYPNVFLAGDWTRNGWPATMEGAVRSGYLAAEAVARSLEQPQTFVLPDVA